MGNLILPKSDSDDQEYNDYCTLASVFNEACCQAAYGKGKERHNRDCKEFRKQPIMTITRDVGLGFPVGQCCKKAVEAIGLLESKGPDAARNELLGAINYLAAAVIYIDELTRNSTGE